MGSYKSIVLRLLQVKKHSALGMGMTEITAIKRCLVSSGNHNLCLHKGEKVSSDIISENCCHRLLKQLVYFTEH